MINGIGQEGEDTHGWDTEGKEDSMVRSGGPFELGQRYETRVGNCEKDDRVKIKALSTTRQKHQRQGNVKKIIDIPSRVMVTAIKFH